MVTWVRRLGCVFTCLFLHFEELELGTDEGEEMVLAEAASPVGKKWAAQRRSGKISRAVRISVTTASCTR